MLLLPVAALVFSTTSVAQIVDRFRGTIAGSLHQCTDSPAFYIFDSDNTRPVDLLFLPADKVTDDIRTGTVTIGEVQALGPILALGGIETPDAQQYDFSVQIEQGTQVEIFAFLPDGQGKNLNLPRTIMTPLPNAPSCLTNIPTTIGGATATSTPTSTQSSSSSTSTQPTSTSDSSSSSSFSSTSSTSTTSESTTGSGTTSNAQSEFIDSVTTTVTSSVSNGSGSSNVLVSFSAILVGALGGAFLISGL